MKKRVLLVLSVFLLLALTSCAFSIGENIGDVFYPDATEMTTSEFTETEEITTPETELIQEVHSDFYVPDVSLEMIVTYFNEIVLDAEFSESDDIVFVQKWVEPIYYKISGQYTADDIVVFNSFCSFINGIEGFPGIYAATDERCNLRVTFGTVEEIVAIKGEEFRGNDGYVTFWFNGNNELTEEEIFFSTEVDQHTRNSVILEELYNGMGPIQDTDLREDSIVFSGFSSPQSMTAVDEVILRLLYHPDIKCGMNAEECFEIIQRLYY